LELGWLLFSPLRKLLSSPASCNWRILSEERRGFSRCKFLSSFLRSHTGFVCVQLRAPAANVLRMALGRPSPAAEHACDAFEGGRGEFLLVKGA